jgi:putative endonuclease
MTMLAVTGGAAPVAVVPGPVGRTVPSRSRAHRGRLACLAGLAAEDSVARDYERRGRRVAARRWRGQSGEIDLVLQDGDGFIFVEVKQAASFADAATHLTRRQIDRIFLAAQEFVGQWPRGSLTNMRFDMALVDGQGRLQITENAFW